jgi:hypothetical protein
MNVPSETTRGIEYLKNIVESGKVLKLTEPRRLDSFYWYLIEITAYEKRWSMGLSRDQLDDLPGTKEYHEAALVLARILESRFKNHNPNFYVTESGRLLEMEALWPARQWMNDAGTNWIAATGLWVNLTDVLTKEVARCAVIITTSQQTYSNPFGRLAVIFNSLRSAVDRDAITFYPSNEALGDHGDRIDFGFSPPQIETKRIQDFLLNKVWLLGFKASRRETVAWIADPWDASYLGCTTIALHQETAVLDAQGKVVLDESGEFASVGKNLLAANGPQTTRRSFGTAANIVADDFDVFVCHATEDKPYVEPLVRDLQAAGVNVWFDATVLAWGDNLRSAIDRGLTKCRYGIVVFSKAFLRRKKWTEYELNSLFGREEVNRKIILPIWHGITRDDLLEYGAGFADRLAKNSLVDSNEDIVRSLLHMLGRVAPSEPRPDQKPGQGRVKPNAIVYARYETTGANAKRADVHVRPPVVADGYFTYEDSFGESQHGTDEEVARRLVDFDRKLRLQGYVRMNYGNLSGNRAFDL